MAVLSEIVDILRHWDIWKRIEQSPARLDTLEKRISTLEAKLQRAPGEACPHCGALEFRTEKTTPDNGPFAVLGVVNRHMKCSACGYTEKRSEAPK